MKLTIKSPSGTMDHMSITNAAHKGVDDNHVQISYHKTEEKGQTHNLRIKESYSFVTDWPVCDQSSIGKNVKPSDDFIVEW